MKEYMNRALRPIAFLASLLSLVGAAPASAVDQSASGSSQGRGKEGVAEEPSRRAQIKPGGPAVFSPDATVPEVRPREAGTAARTESRSNASPLSSLSQPGCTICLGGSASAQWNGNSGSFHIDTISNNRTSGTSGSLDLRMVLTSAAPVYGQGVNYFNFSDFIPLSPLSSGFHYSNVNSGTVSFFGSSIPAGEYFQLMYLREFVGGTYFYVDWVVMDKKVSCNGTGCSVIVPPAGCAEDAYAMCLSGGRYRVTGRWKNQYAGGAQANLTKAKLTDVTGAFWIADANTYEFMARISTATNNGRAWVSILTFTDVEFWVAVTDVTNGQSKEYHSNPGNRTLIFDPSFFVYP